VPVEGGHLRVSTAVPILTKNRSYFALAKTPRQFKPACSLSHFDQFQLDCLLLLSGPTELNVYFSSSIGVTLAAYFSLLHDFCAVFITASDGQCTLSRQRGVNIRKFLR
jgi:hypothetical protein